MNEYKTYDMEELSFAVIGAAMEVHKVLGPGYLENVYEDAIAHELDLRGIPYERQRPVGVAYKGKIVGEGRLDIIVDNRLIIELKAVDALHPIHTAQCLFYLKMTGLKLCLLMNFNVPILKTGIKRIVLSL